MIGLRQFLEQTAILFELPFVSLDVDHVAITLNRVHIG